MPSSAHTSSISFRLLTVHTKALWYIKNSVVVSQLTSRSIPEVLNLARSDCSQSSTPTTCFVAIMVMLGNRNWSRRRLLLLLLLLLPLALQPTVGFGLSNNVLPFFPICHQLSPSSHSQHLKISFYFLFPSFPGSSPPSRPLQFLSEDFLGILSSSILSRWPNQLILCPFTNFTIFIPLLISSSFRFVRIFIPFFHT